MYHHFITMIFPKYTAEYILRNPLIFIQVYLRKEFGHGNLNPPATHYGKTCCPHKKAHDKEVREKKTPSFKS